MKAKATSWNCKPFTEGLVIPLYLKIHKYQIEHVRKGLIPNSMEDKWFIYFEEPYLYLHRSWTGQPVFKLKFSELPTGYYVSEALLSIEIASQQNSNEINYQGKLASFLVSSLLLKENISFPIHPSQIKKKWWQLW